LTHFKLFSPFREVKSLPFLQEINSSHWRLLPFKATFYGRSAALCHSVATGDTDIKSRVRFAGGFENLNTDLLAELLRVVFTGEESPKLERWNQGLFTRGMQWILLQANILLRH
jgi:hypothetical protein